MWDLVAFNDHDLSLMLRRQGQAYTFSYPWKIPVLRPDIALSEVRPEAINLPENRIFDELALRARFGACLQIFRLARSGLNGSIPTSMTQIHHESLKFALRRYEKKLIASDDFLGMLRSAALVLPIPDGFWRRLADFLNTAHIEKLRQSMDALKIFHPVSEDRWLDEIKPYMARVLWFANEFDSIKVVAKQLAILHPAHRDDFNEQGDKAASMLMRAEIEADQANQKPWQRTTAPKLQRSVRTGPVSRVVKKQQADDSEEKN
jgi:hypothetical protein